MPHRLLVVGCGFAGMWSALAAARAADLAGAALDIVVIAPEARLKIRPRFYEADLSGVAAPVDALFRETGVRFVAGRVVGLDTAGRSATYVDAKAVRAEVGYDRLVLACGSELAIPDVPGIDAFAFDNDQLEHAEALQAHLEGLRERPASPARDTVVVVGGGFTGIETAAELTTRLQTILGDGRGRVVLVERASAIGPDLGSGPRPVIERALDALGVTLRLDASVTAIDAGGVALADGTRIEAQTVVWTGGLRANGLAAQVPGKRDRLGRLHVDADLRVVGVAEVFATGDMAHAATDDTGNVALMSCQHAMALGRSAGHNAAAELLGLPLRPYSQPKYVTCLDLGAWGAVYTEGWDRRVVMAGAQAKALKRQINTQWIYPPEVERRAALAAADPAHVVVA